MQQSSTSVCYLEVLLFLISVIEICFWNFNINSVTCHYFVNELEKQKFQNSSRTDTINADFQRPILQLVGGDSLNRIFVMNAVMNLLNTNVLREIGNPRTTNVVCQSFHRTLQVCNLLLNTCGGGNVSKIEGLENMQIFTIYHY